MGSDDAARDWVSAVPWLIGVDCGVCRCSMSLLSVLYCWHWCSFTYVFAQLARVSAIWTRCDTDHWVHVLSLILRLGVSLATLCAVSTRPGVHISVWHSLVARYCVLVDSNVGSLLASFHSAVVRATVCRLTPVYVVHAHTWLVVSPVLRFFAFYTMYEAWWLLCSVRVILAVCISWHGPIGVMYEFAGKPGVQIV